MNNYPKIFQVSEFNSFISGFLQEIGEVMVEGEISEINISQNKWVFIIIKDTNSSLLVFGVLYNITNIKQLSTGMLVRVRGICKLHEKSGRFSLIAKEIMPAGKGSLELAFIRLKKMLEQEGLFSKERKRQITRLPENILLLTTEHSKAYSDFVKVLNQRMGGITIYFYKISVQGDSSVKSILKAFTYIKKTDLRFDAVILLRGGGSLADLQSFNNEQVVREIFACPYPVVTGVGHESDWTLVDLVADLRASTPSNAAELLVPSREDLTSNIDWQINNVNRLFRQKLLVYKNLLVSFNSLLKVTVNKYNQRLISLVRLLDSLDYSNVLKKGYSITMDSHSRILKDTCNLKIGETLTTRLASGKINSNIIKIQ